MRDSNTRSLVKAISWRTIGTIDTFVISLLVTGTLATAGSIAVTEVLTKVTLFYLHERLWSRITWGLGDREGQRRSLLKAVTWRTTGTIDTFLLSWLFTGHVASAGAIAATEVLTKIVLFYLHERAWARVRWGRSDAPATSKDAPAAAVVTMPASTVGA